MRLPWRRPKVVYASTPATIEELEALFPVRRRRWPRRRMRVIVVAKPQPEEDRDR